MTISLRDNYLACSEHVAEFCDHIRSYIESGQDAAFFSPGVTINVPVIPQREVYATVHIDPQTFGESALMEMQYTPDIGRPYQINLGFWNPGEGCQSLRSVILDYMKSQLKPGEKFGAGAFKSKCPNPAHSMRSSRFMADKCEDALWKWECLWNMVMEKACTPCIEETNGYPDDNNGFDPPGGPTPPWSTGVP